MITAGGQAMSFYIKKACTEKILPLLIAPVNILCNCQNCLDKKAHVAHAWFFSTKHCDEESLRINPSTPLQNSGGASAVSSGTTSFFFF